MTEGALRVLGGRGECRPVARGPGHTRSRPIARLGKRSMTRMRAAASRDGVDGPPLFPRLPKMRTSHNQSRTGGLGHAPSSWQPNLWRHKLGATQGQALGDIRQFPSLWQDLRQRNTRRDSGPCEVTDLKNHVLQFPELCLMSAAATATVEFNFYPLTIHKHTSLGCTGLFEELWRRDA